MRTAQEARIFSIYLAASILALLADVSCYIVLLSADLAPALAAALAYLIGLCVHFTLSHRFIIRSIDNPPREAAQLATFAATGLIGLGITSGTVFLLHNIAGLTPATAKLGAVGLSFGAIYMLRRLSIFRARRG